MWCRTYLRKADEFFGMSETPLVIGITGGTGSGKTTLANELVNLFFKDEAICVQQDRYYKDRSAVALEERENINYDCPIAFDNKLLISHLTQLKLGNSVKKPIYDFFNSYEEGRDYSRIPPKNHHHRGHIGICR